MSVSIAVTRNDLPKIASALAGKVAAVNTKAAFDCIAQARPPVDTGNLKNATTVTAATAGDLTAVASWNAEYAPHVEYGTARMAAQPFARPASEAVKPGWIAAMKQAVTP